MNGLGGFGKDLEINLMLMSSPLNAQIKSY